MTTRILNWLGAASVVVVVAGCASSGNRAPVTDIAEHKPAAPVAATAAPAKHARKNERAANDWRPQTYVVQKGDTLYGIAFNYGLDYREISELNNIQNPNMIRQGQELRLFPAEAAPHAPVAESKPASVPAAVAVPVKDQPRTAKLPYSSTAVAELEKMQSASAKAPSAAKPEPKPEAKPETKPEAAPQPAEEDVAVEGELDWGMPTNGKVVAGFSESANRKGVDIAGKLGQPVLASAAGKVVYSGSGLRGYGKLVIIKHNNTYLSAYAHNSNILVKEGQAVSKGQKIAEMGNSDAPQVELHFEIRKLGKPVDPSKYLPLGKS